MVLNVKYACVQKGNAHLVQLIFQFFEMGLFEKAIPRTKVKF